MTQKNTQEVELRALLDKNTFDSIKVRLLKLGAEVCGSERLVDTYFCPKEIESFDALEMDEIGAYSLRLRRSPNNVDLNIKVITQQGDHNSWEEHEVIVDSYEEAHKILEFIGFKNFITITKNRFKYKIGVVNIFLEDIKNFGFAIEAEIVTTRDKGDVAKKTIRELFNKLSIPSEKIVQKSITNLIMREKAKL